jgi:hypothetical protein
MDIAEKLRRDGFVVLDSATMRACLGESWADWDVFAASWDDLPEDIHMADGGRYRRRRFAVFDVSDDGVVRAAHQAHYQSRIYNRLNGGVPRWFEPVMDATADHSIVHVIMARLARLFEAVIAGETAPTNWHVEMHQFRIEACSDQPALPTPEGIHRDGVDGAFVMLVSRRNVSSGVTQIFDPRGRSLGAFTLTDPGDAVFLDDARVFHGVTPIVPLDPKRPAFRDVLVITFLRRN